MKTIISEKGQITIPKACRERLGLRPGTILDVRTDHGRILIVKQPAEDCFHKWRGKGKLPANLSVDEYLDRARA